MKSVSTFTPRYLSAAEYVLTLHRPTDSVAVLVRNRLREQTTQRIVPAETIASAPFQTWLEQQNMAGADIFIGMNPVKEGAKARTKEQILEIRHAYLDLDEDAGDSLQVIRTSGDLPNSPENAPMKELRHGTTTSHVAMCISVSDDNPPK